MSIPVNSKPHMQSRRTSTALNSQQIPDYNDFIPTRFARPGRISTLAPKLSYLAEG